MTGKRAPVPPLRLPEMRAAWPLADEYRLVTAMLLYFATDLLWASKIKGVADALGLPCRPVRTVEMLEARLADTSPTAILIDLTTPEMAMQLLARLRGPLAGERERGMRIVAFGPHVEKELFQQAREAGADEVLPRGAVERNMQEILLGLAGRA